jgi:hypothetical protein
MIVLTEDSLHKRMVFFNFLFGEDGEGYVCIARRGKEWEEKFFLWPNQSEAMHDTIATWASHSNVYFCPTLLRRQKRTKEDVLPSGYLWADLDNCPPSEMLIEPTFVLESSPSRYQALWRLEDMTAPFDIEDVNRRIAYYHRDSGADVSGWDLTQLLRVPLTYNHKYGGIGVEEPPHVKIISAKGNNTYSIEEFKFKYPQVKGFEDIEEAFPGTLPQEDGVDILERYKYDLSQNVAYRFHNEPEGDWSRVLWQLMLLCFEAGMSREEVFVVARDSACNKYKRDAHDLKFLWKDVCRAAERHRVNVEQVTGPTRELPPLLTNQEREWASNYTTFVEEYIEWAKTIGDAAPQYHQAGGFVLLSALLAGRVRLPTSFGSVLPNLWFMILADTTLTRKSTAMDLAMDLLVEVDPDAVLATDGSIEGLSSALSTRPGQPSVFLRDEFSGLLEMMAKKDYYAGMAETFTKLYDGKYQKKILRREAIEIKEPVLILFAGGIRDRVLSLLTYEHVASGFMPRFIFITAESDPNRVKPLGPPTETSTGRREHLLEEIRRLHRHYVTITQLEINGRHISTQKKWDAKLTPAAWDWYNKAEHTMVQAALRSPNPELMTPTFDRLCKSGLKAAVLLAASARQEQEVVVDVPDIVKAFWYVEQWRAYTLEVMNNVGRSASENLMTRIMKRLRARETMLRSDLMNDFHLSARDADTVFSTLEQRGLIDRFRQGKTERIHITAGGHSG